MSLTVVLAIGMNSSLLRDLSSAWISERFIVTSAASIKDAIPRFHGGDFDLVLVGQSISAEDRERLTCLIRSSGSHVPVVSIANSLKDCDEFADAGLMEDSSDLVAARGALISKRARLPALPILAYGNAI